MNHLILVNLQRPFPEGTAQDLVPIHPDFPHVLMEREAATALSRLMERLHGWRQLVPVSGWRSREEQRQIYASALRDHGPDFTRQFVALPGHSEHQTGLAIDLGLLGPDLDFICPAFPYEGICQAFRDMAPAYGFIQRYPAGKEAVTGIAHEPWHFRYVGKPYAGEIARRGLVLEEFLS